eukprot:UN00001
MKKPGDLYCFLVKNEYFFDIFKFVYHKARRTSSKRPQTFLRT